MTERDRSPIDQKWIQGYCDTLLEASTKFDWPMRDAVLQRVDHAMDLLEAWQKRNAPKETT